MITKSIQYIKGVGPARFKQFQRLGVETVEDLLYLFPRRYEDRSKLTPIKEVKLGETYTIQGKVLVRGNRQGRFGRKGIFEMAISDQSGARIFCVWFNQPYLEQYFRVGQVVVLHGKVTMYKNRLQMNVPDFEIIDEKDAVLNTGRIVPMYPLTKGMSQRYVRKIIRQCLDNFAGQLEDLLPQDIRLRNKLRDLNQCIESIHFPASLKEQEQAQNRISFEEFFFFQLAVILRRMNMRKKVGKNHHITDDLIKEFSSVFPFELTSAQVNAINDITKDMSSKTPMLRLLQGDVGSGKTVVSFFGCVAAYANGYQSAIMAPTEILASQHYAGFQKMLESAPFGQMRGAFLHSGLKKKERDQICEDIAEGNIDVVIGTHALIQQDIEFNNLSFVAIDEQHKFGVQQRAVLSSKGGNPDVLIMTATPIPRTLCLTLYGDLDVSIIDESPQGRGSIKSYHFKPEQADKVYNKVKEFVGKGTQAYIVYPLVDESEELDLKSAEQMYNQFIKKEFKQLRVGLVHGQMDRKQTQENMNRFKDGKLDVLVTTTVLEVGIDVPNANVMVIEHAERFGLSQLHQLRGRIGRSEKNAVCMFLADPKTDQGKHRMEAIISTTDGFKIAQADLEIRGPGQYFGRHQHGLNELSIANPLAQVDVLETARKEAFALIKKDPQFKDKTHQGLKRVVSIRYPQYLDLAQAG